MKKRQFTSICLLVLALLNGCGYSAGSPAEADPEAGMSSQQYVECMDTFMTLTAYGSERETALSAAVAELQRLDALLSIGMEDSEVSRLNREGGSQLSKDSAAIVTKALELYGETGGCFDITVSPLMELWGFYSKDYRVPSEAELEGALAKVGADRLRFDASTGSLALDAGQAIDLGGIAKGYASQRIMDLWRELGLTSGLVSLGGNIQCLGTKPDGSPWRVGVQDPANASGIAAVVQITDQAVITSGGYERFFTDEETGRRYQHILDPATGRPVEGDLSSVSVICADGTLGDGLSTALYIMGRETAADYWRQHSGEFEAIFIDNNGEIYITEGLEGSVSSQEPLNIIHP